MYSFTFLSKFSRISAAKRSDWGGMHWNLQIAGRSEPSQKRRKASAEKARKRRKAQFSSDDDTDNVSGPVPSQSNQFSTQG